MLDEDMRDQFATVAKLAKLLEADESFVCEIGLDAYEPKEVVRRLQLLVGFILATYNSAKSIFASGKHQTLDDKFTELIYSRIRLMPELVESTPDLRDYAEGRHSIYRLRMEGEESVKKWEDMQLPEQFCEICVCVFLEEMKLDKSDLHILLPDRDLLLPEWERDLSRKILARTFKRVFSHMKWELDDEPDSPTRTEGDDVDQLGEVDSISQDQTLEHPFLQDWAEAVKSYYGITLEDEELAKIKQVSCSLYPGHILTVRWDGWQLGIPKPKDLIGEDAFSHFYGEATIFLRQFFNRVENDKLYCEWSDVIDGFGEETAANRIAGTTGLHYNLERVYWTFNIKFSNWIRQNKKEYDCSLVCGLDEIVACADSILREAFFPTPGPFDLGPEKRKEYQHKVLGEFAPNLEKPLMEQIWHEDCRERKMSPDTDSKNSTNAVITIARKKPWLAGILCFLFSPFGMFYFGWRPALASLITFAYAHFFFRIYLVKICEPTPWMIPSLIFIWAYTGWLHAKGWNSQDTRWQSDYVASFNFGVLATLYVIWLNVLVSIPIAFIFRLIDVYAEAEFSIRDLLLFDSLAGLFWLFVWFVWFWLGRMFLRSRHSRLGLGASFFTR